LATSRLFYFLLTFFFVVVQALAQQGVERLPFFHLYFSFSSLTERSLTAPLIVLLH